LIGTEHLLLSILKDENNIACRMLNKYGVIYENAKDEVEALLEEENPRFEFPSDGGGDAGFAGRGSEGSGSGSAQNPRKSPGQKSKTPVLDNFGRDLTALAEGDQLDP